MSSIELYSICKMLSGFIKGTASAIYKSVVLYPCCFLMCWKNQIISFDCAVK